MNWTNNIENSNTLNPTNQTMQGMHVPDSLKPTGTAEKKAAVCAEMEKLNQLPASAAKGSYATKRMQVLNKVLQLMSIERTRTQDEELELLFAGLSM